MPLAPVLEIDSSTLVITAGLQYVTKGKQAQVILVYSSSKPLILNENGNTVYQEALYQAIKTAMSDVTPVVLPSPTITDPNSGSPQTFQFGADPYNVALTGTGFLPGATIVINGVSYPSNFNSSVSIYTALIDSSSIPIGTYDIIVNNPDGGTATSTSALVIAP